MFGELQEILDHGWQSLFVDERGVSLILQKDWSHDQARLGVYKVLGWMIDQANNGQLFSKTKLYKTIVSNTHLTPKKGEQLGRNLIKLLQQAGKVEVSARGIDATGILPTVHLV
jgi:hypothetical protein